MPDVPPTLPAPAPTRRGFLTRATGLGALATVGGIAATTAVLAGTAGAQASSEYTDAEFAAFTTPLELAAVQAYQAALEGSTLTGDAKRAAQKGQDHHQTVADALTTLLDADAAAPLPATAFSDPIDATITISSDAPTVLRALAEMEETISATHLKALESIPDPVTAKVVAQVLAIEAQQATYLNLLAGEDLATLTPQAATTDAAVEPGRVDGAPPDTTTTTTAGN